MTNTHMRKIGKTDIEVRAIGLGAMPLSIEDRPTETEGIRVIRAALSAGTNFIDTANAYCLNNTDIGHNERLIRKALDHLKGPSPVIATKGGCIRPNGQWDVDGRPESLKIACEKSLQALGLNTITLYHFHAPDPKVKFEDSIQALANLKQEGKILHVGLSNVTAEQLHTAQKIVRIETVQNRCNLFDQRDFKNGFIDLCKEMQVTYIAYSPVGGHFGHKKSSKHQALLDIATKHNTTPYGVMLSWLLHKGDHILPIPGSSRLESATDSPRAVDLKLTTDDMSQLDKLS